mmetsp:Transcript_22446/g.49054  ORF Transcript_22446/g.49054 Transcript_22446/m.49054 type:complete len:274 (-) Transcript_22446:149-970(-)|eukprot:CAMPEP_0204277582 /NCGR_PEP_ID=MMETSP0468-20130131/29391_1 /ASSEMBLY_ACC=CAM_ASM_000383 /TAXON_ID=2969 /ORGANISM="Oxyrrhis marina" /LENGTH=273 /DNA_ID=CAMNT_0051254391 /DNA_START=46 /DNA_END=867 /DNA_ORIENTATION=+
MALLKDLPFHQALGQASHSSTNLLAYPTALDLPGAKAGRSPDLSESGRVAVGINRKLFRKLQKKDSSAESVCRASPASTEVEGRVCDAADVAVTEEDAGIDVSTARYPDDAASDQESIPTSRETCKYLRNYRATPVPGGQLTKACRVGGGFQFVPESRTNSCSRLSGPRTPQASRRALSASSSSPSFIVASPPTNNFHKVDRVARGIELRRLWSTDKFLKSHSLLGRSSRKPDCLVPPSPSKTPLRRHSYVPPHEKRRDDVRMAMRYRMNVRM